MREEADATIEMASNIFLRLIVSIGTPFSLLSSPARHESLRGSTSILPRIRHERPPP
jgi:hypothetical protein